MRVLFFTAYQEDNLGLRYLAAYLRSHGHDVHILFFEALRNIQRSFWREEDSIPQDADFIYRDGHFIDRTQSAHSPTPEGIHLVKQCSAAYMPDIIGVSAVTSTKEVLAVLLPALRDAAPESFIVGGGPGPSLEPEHFLRLGMDAVIRGEGEESLLELVTCMERGEDWRDIPNISHMQERDCISNPLRPLIKDLDALPFPIIRPECISRIINGKVVPEAKQPKKYRAILARGCSGSCSYCTTTALRNIYSGKDAAPRMRRRRLEQVLEELIIAKSMGAESITFGDDMILGEMESIRNFFAAYGRLIGLPFTACLHPMLIEDETTWRLLCDSGLDRANFGIQSGDADFCHEIYNRSSFSRKYREISAKIAKEGIESFFYFIQGNPLAHASEFEKTLRFIADLTFDPSCKSKLSVQVYWLRYHAHISLLQKYPHIVDMPRSIHHWLYASALMGIRLLCADDDEFEHIRSDWKYKENPFLLGELHQHMIKMKHAEYLAEEMKRLMGKEAFFWGCGWVYQQNKHLFHNVIPRNILVDIPHAGHNEIDGIRIAHPRDVHNDDALPVVIFSSSPRIIYKKIRMHYKHFSDIVTACCTVE